MTKADASYNLHATLGHMSYSRIERMVRRGIWNGYNFDRKFLKDMLNVRCDICLRAKITDASHTGHLYRAARPWRTFSFDVTGPFAAASIHGNYYQSAMMDTCSAMVYGEFLKNKDEAYDVLSDFFDTEIVALRGRDTTEFEIILMSDLGEAHTNKIIKLCRKHGILKQSTAGYTPQHNAFVKRWFRTIGEMSRSQLLQFDMEEEF